MSNDRVLDIAASQGENSSQEVRYPGALEFLSVLVTEGANKKGTTGVSRLGAASLRAQRRSEVVTGQGFMKQQQQ